MGGDALAVRGRADKTNKKGRRFAGSSYHEKFAAATVGGTSPQHGSGNNHGHRRGTPAPDGCPLRMLPLGPDLVRRPPSQGPLAGDRAVTVVFLRGSGLKVKRLISTSVRYMDSTGGMAAEIIRGVPLRLSAEAEANRPRTMLVP